MIPKHLEPRFHPLRGIDNDTDTDARSRQRTQLLGHRLELAPFDRKPLDDPTAEVDRTLLIEHLLYAVRCSEPIDQTFRRYIAFFGWNQRSFVLAKR